MWDQHNFTAGNPYKSSDVPSAVGKITLFLSTQSNSERRRRRSVGMMLCHGTQGDHVCVEDVRKYVKNLESEPGRCFRRGENVLDAAVAGRSVGISPCHEPSGVRNVGSAPGRARVRGAQCVLSWMSLTADWRRNRKKAKELYPRRRGRIVMAGPPISEPGEALEMTQMQIYETAGGRIDMEKGNGKI